MPDPVSGSSGKGGKPPPPPPAPDITLGGGSSAGSSGSSGGSSYSGGSSSGGPAPAAPPTPKEKAKALAEAEKNKLIARLVEMYKATHNGQPPPTGYIERLYRRNPKKLARMLEGGELAQAEKEELLGQIVEDYEAVHGEPAPEGFVKRLLRAKPKKVRKIGEGLAAGAAAEGEVDELISEVMEDYEELNGKPADAKLIASWEKMDTSSLAALRIAQAKQLEQKFKGAQAKDAYLQEATGRYMSLWGLPPPTGYIEGLINQGLNLYEIEDNERAKPAFKYSKAYKDRASEYASRLGGTLGVS